MTFHYQKKLKKMDNPNEILHPIIEKIKKYRSSYEQNEQAVRDQIVNPILKYLGWNPENPEDVKPNISTEEQGVPDYFLIKNGKIVLFVEVKKLSVDIKQEKMIHQLAKYSSNKGIKYSVLTNGAVWILIKSFEEETTLTKSIVWETDLENEELPVIYRKITRIAKTNIEKIEELVNKIQILNNIWQSLLEEHEEMIQSLMLLIKSVISKYHPHLNFEDIEIEDFLKERVREFSSGSFEKKPSQEPYTEKTIEGQNKKPKKMKLESKEFELRAYKDILVNTANWLIKNGKLKPSDCPVMRGGKKRCIVNKTPKHMDDKNFTSPKKISNGLYIETNYSGNDCINHAKWLLQKFGVSPDILILSD